MLALMPQVGRGFPKLCLAGVPIDVGVGALSLGVTFAMLPPFVWQRMVQSLNEVKGEA